MDLVLEVQQEKNLSDTEKNLSYTEEKWNY